MTTLFVGGWELKLRAMRHLDAGPSNTAKARQRERPGLGPTNPSGLPVLNEV